ncbi:MAG: hypothetical protein HQ542_14215 [Bacteroidia bacterium]|nr:hypothetical protein [Bacteroidia bacterium]
MKRLFIIAVIIAPMIVASYLMAQDQPVSPTIIKNLNYHGISRPLTEIPDLTSADLEVMWNKINEEKLNESMQSRTYPYAATAQPKGADPAWQQKMGSDTGTRATVQNFNGQTNGVFPPDPTGDVGPNHYISAYNSAFVVYDKTGNLLDGPTLLNSLFTGLPGAACNSGDPIILYDEQADRWLVIEFSICEPNDHMLIAVSTSADPTGTYHAYSWDVADVPDYEKLGVWRDGYYMGTNTGGNTAGSGLLDIYVFERSAMLTGSSATGIGWENPWRVSYYDSFMCVPPVDNDGPFADVDEPGIFICHADDAQTGLASDQLWIYELDADWTTPGNSTFNRTQQLNVDAYDSNFGANWDNIKQPGTAQELDAVPGVIMNAPQYRNFGAYETIVCCHTVDVDNTDHAGMRWYELRRTTGSWYVRQQGTYAPDAHSRFMGSIRLNGNNELGLAYSISSTSVYPGIRYCGQNAIEYANASETMNLAETTITTGSYSQYSWERWGDYTSTNVDPSDDRTFWYTNMHVLSNHSTKQIVVAAFNVYPTHIYVNKYATAGGNGTSGSPIQTLTQAKYAAGPGTSIYLAPATYDEASLIFDEEGYIFKWVTGATGNPIIE